MSMDWNWINLIFGNFADGGRRRAASLRATCANPMTLGGAPLGALLTWHLRYAVRAVRTDAPGLRGWRIAQFDAQLVLADVHRAGLLGAALLAALYWLATRLPVLARYKSTAKPKQS